MRRGVAKNVFVLWIIVMATMWASSGIANEAVNIVGEVNDMYQLVGDDGQSYEIADTAQGNLLVEEHAGEKVKVAGTVEKDDETLILFVTSFQTLAE